MKKMVVNSDDLVNLFKGLGFNERQIRKLILLNNRYKENVEVLEGSYIHYHDCMLALGYDEFDIHELASIHPRAMFQAFDDGALETYYEKYINFITPPSTTLDPNARKEKNRRNLKTLGLSDDRIDYILKTDLPIAETDPETILDNIVFYLSQGMSEEELVSVVNINAVVLLYGRKEYSPLLEILGQFGFVSTDFTQMVQMYAKNKSLLQPDVMYKTISWALTKKLDRPKFIKCLRTHMIKNLDEVELERAYRSLIDIGFTEEQAVTAVSDNINVLYKPLEKYEYIIEVGRRYAIDRDKMIAILTGFSAFSDLSDEKIVSKISAVTRYNLTDFIVNNPKNLIQGAELIDARAAYLRLFHPTVDGKEFATDVFLDEKMFAKKYNRENQYLKELRSLLKR